MRALQNDGWLVESEQVVISTEKRQGFVDVRAAREVNGRIRDEYAALSGDS